MKKTGKIMDKMVRWIVYVLFTIIIVFLTGISIFGSCYVNTDEYSYFVTDNTFLHIAALLLLLTMCVLWKKYLRDKIPDKIKAVLWKILVIVYMIGIAGIALYVSMVPRADQKRVIDTATTMIHGEFSEFQKGGYMDVYPNQVGIVYLFYWILKIFPFGYKVICVLNAVSLGVILVGMEKIGRLMFEKEQGKYMTGIMTMLFFPLSCYVTFIYGNIMGMALSTLGIYFTMLYFRERKKRWMVIAIVVSALAVLVKVNYLIPLIGIGIFMALDFFRTQEKKMLGFLAGLLILTFGMNSLVQIHTEHIIGQKISQGVPSLAWVTMGMQEGYMACGWHNQYNENVYRNNDCNTKQAEIEVKHDLKERIGELLSKPGYAIKFFFKKTASQWNNPTFEGFWINDLNRRQLEGKPVKKLTGVLGSIAGEPGNKMIVLYCNLFQTILLLGVCMWLLLGKREHGIEHLLLATIFIGGFLFHLVWEAKCQYVLPYFVLLFPYAVRGFQFLLSQVEHIFVRQNGTFAERCKKNTGVTVLVIGMVCVVLFTLAGKKYIDKAIGFGNEAYESFLKE